MSKKSLMISSLAVVIVVGALAYWLNNASVSMPTVPIPTPNADAESKNPNAIANRWQWDNFIATPPSDSSPAGETVEADEARPTSEVPYDVVKIYNILQSMQLDENGRVVPDQTAKFALEKGYEELGPDLSAEALAELQNLIRIGLPGEAGEEAARVLENYYQLRSAEEELNLQIKDLSPADRYEALVQLRRRYLGDDIADQLYAAQDAQARHMFATVAIQQNADLTEEEKQAELTALQQKLNDRLLATGELKPEEVAAQEVQRLRQRGASSDEIYAARAELLGPAKAQALAAADREEAQWQSRFDAFWQARQHVMQAGLEDAERERQIEQLLGQHFSAEELERARFSSLQRQSRERE